MNKEQETFEEALQSCNVSRTSEMQATFSLESLEAIVDDLKKVSDALISVLLKSGE